MTDGQFRLPGRMDVALTASQNNWAPSGIANSTSIYIDPDAAWDITGIDAAAYSGGGNAIERVLVLINEDTTFEISLVGLSGSSDPANQFAWSGTITIGRGESVSVKYDRVALLWRLFATGKVTSGGTTLPVDDATAIAKGSTDATKMVRFECDTLVPTATTVALAVPAANGTIATLALAETFTNKTLTSPTINTPVVAGGTLAGTAIISDGSFTGFKDSNGNELIQVSGVASAVNHILITSAITGTSGPILGVGTGGDSNVDLTLRSRGTGVVNVGISGSERAFAGKATSNPATTSEGADHYRTDLEEPFYYDASRSKWLSYSRDLYPFGHSSSDQAAGVALRIVGLATSDGTSANYRLPFACTMVGYTYSRTDTDSAEFEVMANASTIKLTVATSAINGVSNSTDVDFAADDLLWVRIGASSANAMSPRAFIVYMRRKAT